MRRIKQLVQPNLPKQAFAVAVGGGMQVSAGGAGVAAPVPPTGTPFVLSVFDVDGDFFGFNGGEGAVAPTTFLNGTFTNMAVLLTGDQCFLSFDPPAGDPLTGSGGAVNSIIWTYGAIEITLTWSGTDYFVEDATMTAAVSAAAGTDINITLEEGP